MLGFNQDEYLTSAREIIAARQKAEQVADEIYQAGFSSLFFVLCWRFTGANDGN